jgi:predicted AlkP superfamily phosphohydrolase/phosphomutase
MRPFDYVDPGTGALVVGSLWNVIAGILVVAGAFIATYFVRPLKRLVSKALKVVRSHPGVSIPVFIMVLIVILFPFQNIISGAFLGGGGMEKKVLVIGIDAMDPKVMERLMDEGKLPNFRKLKETGGYSRLETTIPPETPVAWSAAATGANPGKYGIFDFVGRDPGTYLPRLSLTEEETGITGTRYRTAMKGEPFWRITSRNGIPTTVIRWPVTFPPERVNGRMLSGLGVIDLRGYLNSYSFYTSGDLEKGPEDVGKIVKVVREGNEIRTSVFGPRTRSGSGLVESEAPMEIEIHEDHAVIRVDGSEYRVEENGWSDWIRVKFRIDLLTEVHGIFKAYLIGTGPEFNMYVTSVQMDPENPLIGITYPGGYGKELAQEIGLFYTMGMPEDTKAVTEGRIPEGVFLEQIREIERERERMFWHEFERFDGGVYAFGFDAGDRFQHIFWDTGPTPKEIEEYYEDKDRFLGEVLNKMDDDTSLIIFSDHGFSTFERAVSINTWLVENGYMTLTKEPDEMDSGSLFKYVDWERTKAYSLGFVSIFVNLKGREGNGIVEESEKDGLVDEIIGKLSGLTDPETGRKAITNLYKGKDVYDGPYAGTAPDIVVGFEPGYRMSWQNAVGGLSTEVVMDNDGKWKGDHLIDRSHVPGVLFTNFGISKQDPSLMDIAPTVLDLLGLDVPESMDGVSL